MVKSKLVAYMEQVFLFEFDGEITESTDLFKAGLIDSHGYIQLMRFIQKEFDVQFSRSELLSNVVTTLSGLVSAVEAKLQSQQLKSGGDSGPTK